MTTQLQRLGQSVVLVLDPKLLEDHGVDPQGEYRLDLAPDYIALHRVPQDPPECSFDQAQSYVLNRYAQAFAVLSR